jgi:S1-C subfamily serine protease
MNHIRALIPTFVLATASISPNQAFGDEFEQCLFDTNSPATVLIEYSVHTDEGDTTEFGSGFIIRSDGLILTNYHVVDPPADVTVISETIQVFVGSALAKPVPAQLVAKVQGDDLAVLQLPSINGGWPTVTVSSVGNLEVGAPLAALGFSSGDISIIPNGMRTSMNSLVDGILRPWWRTNLALNDGNSGGPVFSRLGAVVGIAVAKDNSNQLVTSIIPIARAQHLLDAYGIGSHPYGACAVFPSCRHPSHGLEGYRVSVSISQWSGERGGGYNQEAWCNDLLSGLKNQYPQSSFTKIGSDESSDKDWTGHVTYNYYCTVRRDEEPIYLEANSEACLNAE